MWNMYEWAAKLPQNSIFQEKPQPGMLLPGHEHNFFGNLRLPIIPKTYAKFKHKKYTDSKKQITKQTNRVIELKIIKIISKVLI